MARRSGDIQVSDDLIQRLRDAAALPTGLHAEAADEAGS
jgi:hypothetical protein